MWVTVEKRECADVRACGGVCADSSVCGGVCRYNTDSAHIASVQTSSAHGLVPALLTFALPSPAPLHTAFYTLYSPLSLLQPSFPLALAAYLSLPLVPCPYAHFCLGNSWTILQWSAGLVPELFCELTENDCLLLLPSAQYHLMKLDTWSCCGVWMVCAGLDPTASGVWSHVDRLTIFFPTIDLLSGLRNLICVEKERKEKCKHMWEVTRGLRQTVRWKQRKTPKWCDRSEGSSMKGDQGCLLLKGEQKWEYLS